MCLPPLDVERLVIPVFLGALAVGVRVDARNGGGAPGNRVARPKRGVMGSGASAAAAV